MAETGSIGGPMEIVEEATAELRHADTVAVQSGAYLLELSLDWIVLRASENIHHLLRESHVTLVDEPLGRFVHAQALHDLRNLFSRLSGTTGIARAYGVRLTDEPDLADVAFQLSDSRVILEAVPSAEVFGECFGSVGGLIAGLADTKGQALFDNGARRMRALTGYDRVTLVYGDRRSDSSRGGFAGPNPMDDVPAIIADTEPQPVPLFPRGGEDSSIAGAMMCAPDGRVLGKLRDQGIRASLRIPLSLDGIAGEFRCDSRTPRDPCFEMHAAAELFAQLFAMQLEIHRLKRH